MIKLKGIYDFMIWGFYKKTFPFWQRIGIHITPNHFYLPIPDTRELNDELWLKHSELIGININEKKQLGLLSLFSSKFKEEYDRFPAQKTSIPYQYYVNNGAFGNVDAEILYCIIRHFKPGKIIEIGSGFSTFLSAQAILKNKSENSNYDCELIVIDPYPSDVIKKGFPGLTKVIREKVQDIPPPKFKELKENDILFIDSSHVLKIGSDVQYLYLDVLPRLNKGVLIHFHDIFLPAEYPKTWVLKKYIFWNEQYLLQAFLAFNDSFEVIWAGSYMHLKHSDKLEKAFNSYKRQKGWPGSFWIRRVK
ncbi:MAG TPA: class I SAM-dependent methyltransferase [Candidatus Korarchaeota archaeon]|nr:class I SAM-dependent methyltransferase [Candidatus Korarchaeota archaeon]